jgi:hypothetical protein
MELVHFISPKRTEKKRKAGVGNQPATCHSSSRKNPSMTIDYFTSYLLNMLQKKARELPFYFTKHSRNLNCTPYVGIYIKFGARRGGGRGGGLLLPATVNQHPPVHHLLDACYDSVVKDPQLSYHPVSSW